MEKATKNSGVNWCNYLYQCQDWHKHTLIHIKSYCRGSPNWKKKLGLFWAYFPWTHKNAKIHNTVISYLRIRVFGLRAY